MRNSSLSKQTNQIHSIFWIGTANRWFFFSVIDSHCRSLLFLRHTAFRSPSTHTHTHTGTALVHYPEHTNSLHHALYTLAIYKYYISTIRPFWDASRRPRLCERVAPANRVRPPLFKTNLSWSYYSLPLPKTQRARAYTSTWLRQWRTNHRPLLNNIDVCYVSNIFIPRSIISGQIAIKNHR